MKPVRNYRCPRRHGSALVLSLIFVVIFSALAAAMAGMSGANVQIAENHRKLDNTRACAESGVEAVRYWMSKVVMGGTTPNDQRFSQLAANLQDVLSVAGITPVVTGTTITIADVPLNPSRDQDFSAVLTKIDIDNVRLEVTGRYGSLQQTIRSNFVFGIRAHNVFDYGLASRGPMHLSGSVDVMGVTRLQVEANAFIVSPGSTIALTMEGRTMIGGNVTLLDSTKIVDIVGDKAGIGGLRGAAAVDNVKYEDTYCEFPEMHPELFYGYATNVLTTASVTGGTHDNVRIPAGMNPTFTGGANLRGVVYIESPNVVTFGGGTTITGIIVTNGDPTYDPPPTDPTAPTIIFGANVSSFSAGLLPPEPQFAGLQDQIGTSVLAPGFRVEFTGTFGTLSGAIGANGVKVSGGTGGTINGSIINYSNNTMTMSGNGNLTFNRSGLTEVPAGFVPQLVLHYDPSSYSEVNL